jgi:hypothetical protein
LAVYTTPTDDCDPAALQIAGNDYVITNGVQTNSQVTFEAIAGTTYYISVNGNADIGPPFDQGNYVLNWNTGGIQGPPPNDYFTNATVISGPLGTTNGSNVGATLESFPSCERNFFYTFNPTTFTYTFTTPHQFRLVCLDGSGQWHCGI